MANMITVQCKANPIPFYDVSYTGSPVLGQVPFQPATLRLLNGTTYTFAGQVQHWQARQPYIQKMLMSDVIQLMLHFQAPLPGTIDAQPQLMLCDNNGNELPAYTGTLNAAPCLKGMQAVSGNNYIAPDGTVTPLYTYLWAFSLANLSITTGGIYYLKIVNTQNQPTGAPAVQTLYSEPLLISNECLETRLFQYAYAAANSSIAYIAGNWYSDYPANTMPYYPVFSLRCEAYRTKLNARALLIGYLQQGYYPLDVNNLLRRAWTLCLGEVSLGIPEYLLEKAACAITADNWYFDNGYQYSLRSRAAIPASQTSSR